MRTELKILRIKKKLNQNEFAKKVGVSSSTYSQIERGAINSSQDFWTKLQEAFSIKDEDMWRLMQNDKDDSQEEA